MSGATNIDAHLRLLSSEPMFDVEISAICNLRCTVCPRGGISRPMGLMDAQTIRDVAAFLPPRSRVAISGLGEPLMNPAAAQAVEAFRSRGARVGIVTNASLLSPELATGLIAAGLDFIEMSWPCHLGDAGAAESIRASIAAFADSRPKTLKAYLSVTLTDPMRDELLAIRAFAGRHRLTPLVRPVHSRGGALYLPAQPARRGCGLFAKVTFVAWDGTLLSCCNDVKGESALGSVRGHDFEALLRSKEDAIRSGSWFPACGRCDDPHRFSLLDKPLPGGI